MRIEIEVVDLSEPGIMGFTEETLWDALRPVQTELFSVLVRVTDVNGPTQGGVDKHCMIAVRLNTTASAVVDDIHSDARTAVLLATAKVERWLKWQKEHPSLALRLHKA